MIVEVEEVGLLEILIAYLYRMNNITLNLHISFTGHLSVDSEICDSAVIAGCDQVTKTVSHTPDNVAVVLQTCQVVTRHPGPEPDTVVLTSCDHYVG